MKKINKLNNKGFAMTGVLYMALLIFLILIVSLLNMFLSRKNVLDKIKNNAIANVTSYSVYYNGMEVYYNPEIGKKCTEEEYNNNSDKLGKTGCLKWYTFNDNDSSPTVDMILDHNTTSAVAWNSSADNTVIDEIKTVLASDISSWNNDIKETTRLIEANEVAKITGNNNFDQDTALDSEWFYFDTLSQDKPSVKNYGWLHSEYYWTSNKVVGTTGGTWGISSSGALSSFGTGDSIHCGVRPVITVSKVSISYPKYDNGAIVYFDPNTGLECKETDYTSNGSNLQNSGCMKWYIFNDSSTSSNVNMILDHNTTAIVAWNSTGSNSEMKEVKSALENDVSSWNDNIKNTARLIQAGEVAKITGNTTFNNSSNWFYLDSNNQVQTATTQGASKYDWLFNYTNSCINYGCNIEYNNTYGYWTQSSYENGGTNAWYVGSYGRVKNIEANYSEIDGNGVRPVITVPKSLLTNVVQATKFGYSTDNLIVHLDGLIAPIGDIWYDQSGNGNNAILLNINNTSTSGYQGDGVLLDGIDDDFNINLKNVIPANSDFTVQFIFTNYDLSKWGLFSSNEGWGSFASHLHSTNGSGSLYIGTSGDNEDRFIPTDINYLIKANTLTKITYIYKASTKDSRLIISTEAGKQVDIKDTFITEHGIITGFQPRMDTSGAYNYTNNKYSQILIYNRVLTDDEIEQNYKIDKIRFGI